MSRPLILHPFLFASFASLSLIANNLAEIDGRGAWAFVLSLALAVGIFVIFWLLTHDNLKAGLCASGAIVLFFAYGHIENQLSTLFRGVDLSLPLLILWAVLFAYWLYWVLRKSKNLVPLSNGLNVVAVALNLLPVYMILTYAEPSRSDSELAVAFSDSSIEEPVLAAQPNPPDIFYIVLDAYARGDVLENIYDYDNMPFLNELESRGFVVDRKATANYTHSNISIASSLNMRHLTDLPAFLRENDAADHEDAVRSISGELIRGSALRTTLESLGYEIIAFDSGYGHTRITDADEFLSSSSVVDPGTSEIGFELMLLDTTLGREFVELLGEESSPHNKLFTAHRERVLFTLANLPEVAGRDGPQFVFAHIISPHVPFVFGPNGEEISGVNPYTLLDATGGHEANIGLYRDQLHYLNSQVLTMIDELLERSDEPPIIVLQSDHGSKVYSHPDPPADVEMALLLPILNAIHAPDAPKGAFYSGMTPVNTFRQILNVYFGADLELQADSGYILAKTEGGWEFVSACEIYGTC